MKLRLFSPFETRALYRADGYDAALFRTVALEPWHTKPSSHPAPKKRYQNFKFADAAAAAGLTIASGVIGAGPDGKIPESAEEEFRLAWQGVGRTLEAAGKTYSDIVEFTSYHVGLQANMGTFMKVEGRIRVRALPGVDRHRDYGVGDPWRTG